MEKSIALLAGKCCASRLLRRLVITGVGASCLLALVSCTIQLGVPANTSTSTAVKIVQDSSGATLILVPVKINNTGPYTFALDTGASVSAVDLSIAQNLKLPAVGKAQPVAGVGGQQQEVPVKVTNWIAGSIRLPAATIGSLRLFGSTHGGSGNNLQGLLGSDVLQQFGQITIDYSSGQLTVAKTVASVPHSPATSAGALAATLRRPNVLDEAALAA